MAHPPDITEPPATLRQRCSRGERLLELTEMMGGAASECLQGIFEAGAAPDDFAIATSVYHVCQRRNAAAAASAEAHPCAARSRVVDLLEIAGDGDLQPVFLVDALLAVGPDARDRTILKAAFQRQRSSRKAPLEHAEGDAGAAEIDRGSGAAVPPTEAGAMAAVRSADDGAVACAPGPLCTICCILRCTEGEGRYCGACRRIASRLYRQTDGGCRRAHLRAAFSELRPGGDRVCAERRALKLYKASVGAAEAGRAAAKVGCAAAEAGNAAAEAGRASAEAGCAAARMGCKRGRSVRPGAYCKARKAAAVSNALDNEHATADDRGKEQLAVRWYRAVEPAGGIAPHGVRGSGAADSAKPGREAVGNEEAAAAPRRPAAKICSVCQQYPTRMRGRNNGTYCQKCINVHRCLVYCAVTFPMLRAEFRRRGPGAFHPEVQTALEQQRAGVPTPMCRVCRQHPIQRRQGSYCAGCHSLSANLLNADGSRVSIAAIRAAFQRLGPGASHPQVRAELKQRLSAPDEG